MDRRWILAGTVALASALAGVWWGRGVETTSSVAPSVAPIVASIPATTSPAHVVHVAGWVTEPGLVSVGRGARVGDAVAAAGGARPGARLDSINLAEPVVDGQRVVVPGPGEEGPGGPSTDEGEEGGGLLRLNVATASELESLPGVGPVLAERIVAHRESHGPFQQVEDLLDVAGIGESKLGSIRELVAVP